MLFFAPSVNYITINILTIPHPWIGRCSNTVVFSLGHLFAPIQQPHQFCSVSSIHVHPYCGPRPRMIRKHPCQPVLTELPLRRDASEKIENVK